MDQEFPCLFGYTILLLFISKQKNVPDNHASLAKKGSVSCAPHDEACLANCGVRHCCSALDPLVDMVQKLFSSKGEFAFVAKDRVESSWYVLACFVFVFVLFLCIWLPCFYTICLNIF